MECCQLTPTILIERQVKIQYSGEPGTRILQGTVFFLGPSTGCIVRIHICNQKNIPQVWRSQNCLKTCFKMRNLSFSIKDKDQSKACCLPVCLSVLSGFLENQSKTFTTKIWLCRYVSADPLWLSHPPMDQGSVMSDIGSLHLTSHTQSH